MKINTGLKSYHYLWELEFEKDSLTAKGIILDSNRELLIFENCAQAVGMHARKKIEFSRHVFLCRINKCNVDFDNLKTAREIFISAKILGFSENSVSYNVFACKNDFDKGSKLLEGKFLFSFANYDNIFKSEILKSYYKKIYQKMISKNYEF